MKRLLSLVLALVVLFAFAACGNDASSSEPGDSLASRPQTPQPAPSESEPEPQETLEDYYARIKPNQSFLTGYQKDADYPEGQRAAAVMVNNAAVGWPHRGISECEVLFEIAVEYEITRLMMVFEDYKTMPEVGPMRSARDQFLQFIIPWWMFYIHDGKSTPTRHMLEDWDYAAYDLDIANAFRDNGLSAPYNEFTDGGRVEKYVADKGFDDYRSYPTMFNFVSYELEPRVPDAGTAKDITVVHTPRAFMSYFEYDAATHLYTMSMHNQSTGRMQAITDANNGERPQFTNVLVIFAPCEIYPQYVNTGTPLPQFDYSAGGLGFYFSEGGYEMVHWLKGGPNEALLLYDWETQEPLYINTGRTYVGVVKDKYQEDFYNTIVNGTASQVAGEGDVVTDIIDED